MTTICKFFIRGNCRYGVNCWYLHPQENYGQAHGFGYIGSSGQQNRYKWMSPVISSVVGTADLSTTQQNVSPQEVIANISREMQDWESSNMWPFSCVGLEKGPTIPGIDDLSAEELRFQAYDALKSKSTQVYIQMVQHLKLNYNLKRNELKKPSDQLKEKLVEFIEGRKKNSGSILPSKFGNNSSVSAFGASAGRSNVFGSGASSVFGQQQQQTTSVFGGATSFSTQGRTATFGSSASVFDSQPQNGIFGQASNVFGAPPPAGVQTSSVFGGASSTGSQPGIVFGDRQSVDLQSNIFGSRSIQSQGLGNAAGLPSQIPHNIYTPLNQLSAEQRAQFEAQQFELGKIPAKPPPCELTH